jgi:hypothetical protein
MTNYKVQLLYVWQTISSAGDGYGLEDICTAFENCWTC